MYPKIDSLLTHLECPECGKSYDADQVQTFCQDCRSPLFARYDLASARRAILRDIVPRRPKGMWRWGEVLPVGDPGARLSAGEGDTPLLRLPRVGAAYGLENISLKDEAAQASGSFKSRGLAVALSRALELGLRKFVIPTAGNAGGALAAYAARARALGWQDVEAHVFMPSDAPAANQREVSLHGASLHLVDGLIGDAAHQASQDATANGWFDVSTFKEPYRVEGKKILAYELAEALGWKLPDVLVYPTGGGTGLVGMWKAFAEMEDLAWTSGKRPRLVSVQAEGCAPVVKAFQEGSDRIQPWENAHTIAAGLRVPAPFADRLILRALRDSSGTAVSVSDDAILAAGKELARGEGIFAAPEGAATLAAIPRLLESGWLKPSEQVVLFNTGSGLKYI